MNIIIRNEMMMLHEISHRLARRCLVDLEIGEPVRDHVGLVEIVVVVGNASWYAGGGAGGGARHVGEVGDAVVAGREQGDHVGVGCSGGGDAVGDGGGRG